MFINFSQFLLFICSFPPPLSLSHFFSSHEKLSLSFSVHEMQTFCQSTFLISYSHFSLIIFNVNLFLHPFTALMIYNTWELSSFYHLPFCLETKILSYSEERDQIYSVSCADCPLIFSIVTYQMFKNGPL